MLYTKKEEKEAKIKEVKAKVLKIVANLANKHKFDLCEKAMELGRQRILEIRAET